MIRHVLASLLLLSLVCGCGAFEKKPAPPPLAPPLAMSLRHHLGTPLSGPRGGSLDPAAAQRAIGVQVRAVALHSMPAGGFSSFGASVKLIAASRAGQAVRATAYLTQGVRYSLDEDASARFDALATAQPPPVELFRVTDAVITGATSTIEITEISPADATVPGAFAILLHQPDDAPQTLQLALARDGLVAADAGSEETPAEQSKAISQSELAMFDPVALDGGRKLLLLIPWSLPETQTQALAVLLEFHPDAGDDTYAAAVRWAMEDLARSIESASLRPTVPATGSTSLLAIDAVLESMSQPEHRRASLAYLATQTGAQWCEDVALVGSDEVLEALSQQIIASATTAESKQREMLAGLCDLSAFQLLARLQSEKKLTAELEAILTRHGGEAGRHESSMQEIARNLTSLADLENRLVAENLIYLEDTSPASRVRAYDWLAARGRAPEGFDPLGPAPQRRAALEKAFAPAGGGQP